jgi:Condensation domain
MTNDAIVSPLTFGQLSLWRSDQEVPAQKRPEWHFTRVWDVPETASTAAVQAVVNLLAERHESLRTTIDAGPARPCQVVRAHAAADIPVEVANGTAETAWAVAERLAAHPFDLSREYGWRALVLQDATHRPRHLCLAFHHLVADTSSLEVLKSEYAVLVRSDEPERTAAELSVPCQPRALAAVQQSERWRPRAAAATDYWRTVLSHYPRGNGGRSMSFSTGSGRFRATATSPSFGQALARIVASTRVTTQAAILAVILEAIAKYRIHMEEPLVLMTSNRFEPRWRHLVSSQNQATMLAIPEPTDDFADFAGRVDWACRLALRHGCYDFDEFTNAVTELRGAPLNYDYFFNYMSTEAVELNGGWTGPAPADIDLGASPQSTGPRLEVRVHGDSIPTLDVRVDPDLMTREDLGALVRWVYDRVHAVAMTARLETGT